MAEETRQQRRARERRNDGAVRGSTAAAPLPLERKTIRAWHIALGIPAAFVVIGMSLALAGGAYFWPGIYFATAGIVWLLIDWCIFSKSLVFRTRLTGAIGTLIIAGLPCWMAFRPAPLSIFSIADNANYAAGQDIFGIKWNDSYSELRTIISNASSEQYRDVEILVRADLLIREIGSNKGGACSFEPYLPGMFIGGPSLSSTDAQGRQIKIPTPPNTGNIFKILCDKIPPLGTIEIVAAVIPTIATPRVRTKPSWAFVQVSYLAFGRPETKTYTQCFIGRCSMPASIDAGASGVFHDNPI